MIRVTKTYLPSREKFDRYIDGIYRDHSVTNYGKLVQELELRLADYLGVEELILVANGTIALEVAYRALALAGNVITSPFSFVASASSLVANKIDPVFVDINPKTFNLDEDKIEASINKQTSAILAIHVYGNCCPVEKFEQIAKRHQLKLIFDAAHCFGVNYRDRSILEYGDISTISFHATKPFHTIEGGAVVTRDKELARKIRYLINFGYHGQDDIRHLGTNGKMNEFEAAIGLCLLDEIDDCLARRSQICQLYTQELGHITQLQELNENANPGYGYFPILLASEQELLTVVRALNQEEIHPRRYFYPSLDTLAYLSQASVCPISRDIASRILCLPLYPELSKCDQSRIIRCVQKSLTQ